MSPADVPRADSTWSRWAASPWLTPTVALVALLAAALASRGLADRWLATHWLFRYGDGLRRRALVGTAVEPLAETVSLELVTVLGLLPLAVLGVLLVRLAVQALREDPSTATAVVAAVLLVAPSTLPFLTFELGRFDTLTLLAVVATLLVLPRLGRWSTAALVGVVGGVGVAVHEAFVAVHLPLLLAGVVVVRWHGERRDRLGALVRRDLGPLVLAVAPAAAVTAWIWTSPYLEEAAVGTSLRTLAGYASFEPHEDSVRIHARDLGEVLDYTYGGLADAGPLLVAGLLLTVLVACVPPAVLAGRVLRRRAARLAPTPLDGVLGAGRLLWVAALCPLLMVPIAIDWGRWAALAAINLAVAALWVTVLPARLPPARTGGREASPAAPARELGGRARSTWIVVAVLALLPPIGPTGGFELSDPLADLGELVGAVQRTLTGEG